MSVRSIEGLVLKKIPYGDRDWIVTLLLEDGHRLSALAPGARVSQKRFGGALDLFNRLHLQIKTSQNHAVLESVEIIDGMDGIRRDLGKFAAVCYFAELVLEFLHEGEANLRLYEVFFQFLESLKGPEAMLTKIIPLMEIHCLDLFGFRPVLGQCLDCNGALNPELSYHFMGSRGGVVCQPCRSTNERFEKQASDYPLKAAAIQEILRGYALKPQGWTDIKLAPADVSDARRAFEYFIQYTAGKPFKSLHFLSRIVA